MIMDRKALIAILKEEGYPDYIVENTIVKIEHLQTQVSDAFNLWIKDQKEPSLSIEGYTFSTLVNQFGMKPVAAFLVLDWLVRDPQKATFSLKKGIK